MYRYEQHCIRRTRKKNISQAKPKRDMRITLAVLVVIADVA